MTELEKAALEYVEAREATLLYYERGSGAGWHRDDAYDRTIRREYEAQKALLAAAKAHPKVNL